MTVRKSVLKFVVIIVIVLLASYVGYLRGTRHLNSLVLEAYFNYDDLEAINLRNDIKLLQYLHDGNTEASKKMLEYLVDEDVVYLDLQLKHKKYKPWTKKRILDAMKEAKKYRNKYPYLKSEPPALRKEVYEAFQNISGR